VSEIQLSRVDLKVRTAELSEERAPMYAAATILGLAGVAIRFSKVERTPRYEADRRESDVEHSYMLGMVASELAEALYPDTMNASLVNDYAMVHDLVEIKTGDVATFRIDAGALAAKKAAEHAALQELMRELPPRTGRLLWNYEQQSDAESRFVCAVDKNLPIAVDILGAGQKVMNEDYEVHSHEQLASAHDALRERMNDRFSEFPEIVRAHALLCELFEDEFVATPEKQ